MSVPPESQTTDAQSSAEHRALMALATPSASSDATTIALRYGLARRPGQGIVAGVCAALVQAYGLPPKLVRALAVVLGLLGPGLVFYLALFLVLPRVPAGDDPEVTSQEYDIPLRSLRMKRLQPGDVVVAASIVPALIIAVALGWLYLNQLPLVLAFLLPLAAFLSALLFFGAWKASRVRTTYLFAALAKDAGVIGERELWRRVDALRAEAPRAWAGPEVGGPDARPRSEGVHEQVDSRRAWLILSWLALAALANFSLISLAPHAVPAIDPAGPLVGLSRLGVALGCVGFVAGVLLIRWGRRGRRSPQVLVAGLACVLALGTAVSWIRLTDSRGVEPITLHIAEYQPGAIIECNPGGVRQWNRPLVIDLSDLESPPSDEQAREAWESLNPSNDPAYMDLSMTISCYRGVGDVHVVLPERDWPIDTSLSAVLGNYDASQWQGFERWDPTHVSINVIGELTVGDVSYSKGSGGVASPLADGGYADAGPSVGSEREERHHV